MSSVPLVSLATRFLVEASKELYIHRNTLIYRLSKIEELTNKSPRICDYRRQQDGNPSHAQRPPVLYIDPATLINAHHSKRR
jgi:hypothetical protein